MKGTSIFGGVKVFTIFISIIRTKIIAVLLGPGGIGVLGLLNSTIVFIASLTEFGLKTSSIKDIAAANSTQNKTSIAVTITVIRRLVWITGVLGGILVLMLSPWLSQLTFGNKEYTLAFIWLSITLLFMQLTNGQLVILQGMHKLKLLAKANIYGSALGLVVTLPFYYIYGIDGIVPGIIGTSLVALFLSWYFAKGISIEKVKLSYTQTFSEGKNMLRVGFFISLSSLLTLGASNIVRIFISRIGNVEQVGLYTAGFAIINVYVGLIFTAMETDYYPRLSAVAHDNKLSKQNINKQAEIAILILSPILIIFLVFLNWVVILLYSKQFIAVSPMIYWAALAMFFKAASWPIAFIFLAKGTGKLFFLNELIANIYFLALNLLGYYFLGLTGLGLSFLIFYFLYLIQVYIITKIKFKFSYDSAFIRIFVLQFLLAMASFLTVKFLKSPYTYFVGGVLILISSWYSWNELDKRLDLKTLFRNIKNKF